MGPFPGATSELDLVRREYESSVSWRVTRPLRALGRRARAVTAQARRRPSDRPWSWSSSSGAQPGAYDSWLEHLHGERLGRIDAACKDAGEDAFALFRDLDDDLWALLLTQAYEAYPNIRSRLPSVPDPSLQRLWNGSSGAALASQSMAFYGKLRERFEQHSDRSLGDARVLDFGCGWGRLTRFLARDVRPGSLYGCDPVEQILEVCRASRVPATLARTEFIPERLPFDEPFDLAFAFSVFTHLSEPAHEASLRALHAALRPGAILVVTVRPPAYLRFCDRMHPVLESLGPDPRAKLEEPRYLFAAHDADPGHPQYAGPEMAYGETVITLPYVRQRWSPMFELLDVDLLVGDLYQVMLTLRRR
jgi:SAM-dependent methyltransferase